jgi:hypothetical protein
MIGIQKSISKESKENLRKEIRKKRMTKKEETGKLKDKR